MVKTLIEDLSDSILVHTFQLLPFYDRLNIERVCRRWRKLAVWESWSNFKKFSYKEFLLDPENKLHYPERFSKVVYECQKRQISYEEFETLFSRCGNWLEELSLEKFQIYEGICFSILPMLPALRHLHMADLVESGSLLQRLAGWLTELRSIVFQNMKRYKRELGPSATAPNPNRIKEWHAKFQEGDLKNEKRERTKLFHRAASAAGSTQQPTPMNADSNTAWHGRSTQQQQGDKSIEVLMYPLKQKKHYQLTNSLAIFLGQASKLEYLEIKQCAMGQLFNNGILYNKNGSSIRFPTNLRYLSIDENVESAQLLEKLGEQCSKLECLEYSAHVLNLDRNLAKRLKYLQIKLDHQQKDQFLDCLDSLSNLQALELYIVDQRGAFFTDHTFKTIAEKCRQLEHVSIAGEDSSNSALKYAGLLSLAQLDKLTSLELRTCDKYDCKQVSALFQAVSEKAKLRNLRNLAVFSLDSTGYAAVCKTMLYVHKGESRPKTCTDDRILKIRVASYGMLKCDYTPHAWVNIGGELDAGPLVNEARERIRLGKLSSVASYMEKQTPQQF